MKSFIVFVATAMFSLSVLAQESALNKFFDKYEDEDNFISINLSTNLLNKMVSDKEAKAALEGIEKIKILAYSAKKGDNAGERYYEEVRNAIPKRQFEDLMVIKSDEGQVNFKIHEEGDKVTELVLIAGSYEGFVLLSLLGDINLDKLSELAENMDIDFDGMEHFKELGDCKDKKGTAY